MSLRLPSLKRVVASGALLVWCALAALIPAADAAAERASAGSRSHVEAVGGGAACTPAHDHLACQLCRMLRLPLKAGDVAPVFAVASVARQARPSGPTIRQSRDRDRVHRSRAPPTA